MSNPLDVLSRWAMAPSSLTPDDQSAMQDMRAIGGAGLAATGLGAALRGGKSLMGLFGRATTTQKPKYPSPIMTDIPIPVARDSNKQADFNPQNAPWSYPLLAGVAGLGAYGGWKGMDALFNKQQTVQKQKELADAKTDFESALMSNYKQPKQLIGVKTAGDELGELLDNLYDNLMTKSAMPDWVNKAIGDYGIYAMGTAAPAAYWAYNKAQSGSDRAILNKAMDRRTRAAYLSRPSEIYAIPKPVPVGLPTDDDDSNQTAASPLSTYAGG